VVFSTNKTDRHEITEILLIVALNTITITLLSKLSNPYHYIYWKTGILNMSVAKQKEDCFGIIFLNKGVKP